MTALCACGCGTPIQASDKQGRPRRFARYHRERGIAPPLGVGEAHPGWRGDAAEPDSKRRRARQAYPVLPPCAVCGAPAIDRHHRDGDTGNNTPENVQPLCRRCHMQADGRMDQFVATARANSQPRAPQPCTDCARPYKPLRKGLCARCYDRRFRPNRRRVGEAAE